MAQGIAPATPRPAWPLLPGDGEALAAGRVFVPLTELGVITATGEDARRFLQGQLTNDVEHLSPGAARLNGLCTAKGRLLAVFVAGCTEDHTIVLALPRELAPAIAQRLSMFVLRAKAKLADASDAWRAFGLVGRAAEAALDRIGVSLAEPVGSSLAVAGGLAVRLHPAGGQPRVLLLGPAAVADAWPSQIGLPACSPGAWWWSAVTAAEPLVWAATQERYVPQMINLEVLGGVSFRKGCYPGQEVVARSQYLGKLKRRMARGHAADASPEAVAAGDDVFLDGTAAGSIVLAAQAPGGGVDLLFEASTEQVNAAMAAGATLRLRAPDGPPVVVQPLPYDLRDVTA